jgi:hypothetical protein
MVQFMISSPPPGDNVNCLVVSLRIAPFAGLAAHVLDQNLVSGVGSATDTFYGIDTDGGARKDLVLALRGGEEAS